MTYLESCVPRNFSTLHEEGGRKCEVDLDVSSSTPSHLDTLDYNQYFLSLRHMVDIYP